MFDVQRIFPDVTAGWGWHERPHTLRYVGQHDRTYIAWVDAIGGWWVGSYDHNAKRFTKTKLGDSGRGDDHNTPSILIRNSDKRVVMFMAGHGTSKWYWRISTNPEDISSFGVMRESPDGVDLGGYAYMQPVELTDEGRMYLFCRHNRNRNPGTDARLWDIFISDDNAETFYPSDGGLWYEEDTRSPYAELYTNGKDTIWFARSDWMLADPEQGYTGSSRYRKYLTFAKYTNGSFYKADGTKICDWGDLPITDRWELDMVWNSDEHPHDIQVYAKDIVADESTGEIAIAFTTMNVNDEINHHWYARWDGQKWSTHHIVEAGYDMTEVSSQPAYEGGISINPNDIDEVVLGREYPNTGSKEWEIEIWRTSDKGQTWTLTDQITERYKFLPKKQWRPFIPLNHHPEMKVLWVGGPKYQTFDDFETYLYQGNSAAKISVDYAADGKYVDFTVYVDEYQTSDEVFLEYKASGDWTNIPLTGSGGEFTGQGQFGAGKIYFRARLIRDSEEYTSFTHSYDYSVIYHGQFFAKINGEIKEVQAYRNDNGDIVLNNTFARF